MRVAPLGDDRPVVHHNAAGTRAAQLRTYHLAVGLVAILCHAVLVDPMDTRGLPHRLVEYCAADQIEVHFSNRRAQSPPSCATRWLSGFPARGAVVESRASDRSEERCDQGKTWRKDFDLTVERV